MSSWSKLAQVALSSTPLGPVSTLLKLLEEATAEAAEDAKDLVESPIVAGRSFLYRAEHEPAERRLHLVKAQDEFTKLLEYQRRPLLAAKSAYFVGFCHLLLGNDQRLQLRYYARAALGIMDAIEQCERARYAVVPATFFTDFADDHRLRVARQHGIRYDTTFCKAVRNGSVQYARKDDFMRGVQTSVNVVLPVCCVDFIEELCPEHRLTEDYVAAHGRWRRFSDHSAYPRRREQARQELARWLG